MYIVVFGGTPNPCKTREEALELVKRMSVLARRGILPFPQVYVAACGRCGGNCWNCLYADACPRWMDTGTDPAWIEVEIEKL